MANTRQLKSDKARLLEIVSCETAAADLNAIYRLLNSALFGNTLPTNISVHWGTSKKNFGAAKTVLKFRDIEAKQRFMICFNRGITRFDKDDGITILTSNIRISRPMFKGERIENLMSTMVHEMCHIEQYMNKEIGGHTAAFNKTVNNKVIMFKRKFGICLNYDFVSK